MKKSIKSVNRILFGLYVLILIYIFIVREIRFTWSGWPWSSFLMEFTNLVPFRTMWSYVEMMSQNVINTDTVVRFFAGNLIVFLPMGYLLPALFPSARVWRRMAAYSLLVTFVLECLQILTKSGSLDIDTFLLRTIGATAGFGIYKLAEKYFSRKTMSAG